MADRSDPTSGEPAATESWQQQPGGAAGVDLLAGGSLPRAWATGWRRRPGAPALMDAASGVSYTGGDLDERTARLAGRLHRAGLRAGDRVLIGTRPSAAQVLAHIACLRLGLVVVLCNPAYREGEVTHLARDAEPVAAIVDDPERGRWASAAVAGGLRVLDVDIDLADAPPPPLDSGGPDDPALLMYTSGTTGHPRGAALSHANLLAGARALTHAWHWTCDDRLVLALPLFHAHGLCVGIHGTLLAGASAVVMPRFDAEAVLGLCREPDATLFFGVPTMYSRLVRSPHAGALAHLRLCVSGSAPLPPELFFAVEQVSGQRVLERYGMTETLMLFSNPCDGDRRPGTVGVPLPGVTFRLGGSGEGEVSVRGPSVFGGYWRNPDATAEVLSPDGWFRTGDVGRLDERGYLRLVGRRRELIITGGFNVYPREVEEVLCTHPAVAEAAVVGLPSADWGESVAAAVVLVPGAEDPADDELLGLVRERLAAYKVPRRLARLEALPRTALGKVLRDQVRHQLEIGNSRGCQ